MDFKLVAKFLEDSGDHATSVSTEVLKNKGPQVPENLLNIFKQLGDMLTKIGMELIEAFLLEDIFLTLKVLERRNEYGKLYEMMLFSLNYASDNIRNYMTKIVLNLERINENNIDIAELTAPITIKSPQ